MSIAIGVILILCFIILCFCVFVSFRNAWVYKKSIEAFDRSLKEYHSLPDYDTMMWKFWIWDIEKFKGKK